MADMAAQRALRTMDLIPFILEHPEVSIRRLAEQFSVPEKQIESDLQLIFMCGLPGYTPYELIDLIFENGVVSIIDPQVLNKPRRFTKNELIVIALGLQILRDLSSEDSQQLEKIDVLVKKMTNLGTSNSIIATPIISSNPFLGQISRAISENKTLQFEYQSISKDKVSSRKVIPNNLYFLNGYLYLSATDLLAHSERVFRVDQLKNCEIGENASITLTSQINDDIEVVLDVESSCINFIERNSSIISSTEQTSSGFRAYLKISNLEWLRRSILSHAPGIRVIRPASLSGDVGQLASAILSTYDSTTDF